MYMYVLYIVYIYIWYSMADRRVKLGALRKRLLMDGWGRIVEEVDGAPAFVAALPKFVAHLNRYIKIYTICVSIYIWERQQLHISLAI